MKLTELKKFIDRSIESQSPLEDSDVVIAVKLPYLTVGALPMVPVKSAHSGFDWESGKFILTPAENLTPSDRDFAKQMTDMQDRAARADHDNRNLKAEIRRLKKQIKDGAGGKYSGITSDGDIADRQRQWVGLTHDEVDSWELPDRPTVFEFAQFIEAKLKEKNT